MKKGKHFDWLFKFNFRTSLEFYSWFSIILSSWFNSIMAIFISIIGRWYQWYNYYLDGKRFRIQISWTGRSKLFSIEVSYEIFLFRLHVFGVYKKIVHQWIMINYLDHFDIIMKKVLCKKLLVNVMFIVLYAILKHSIHLFHAKEQHQQVIRH